MEREGEGTRQARERVSGQRLEKEKEGEWLKLNEALHNQQVWGEI